MTSKTTKPVAVRINTACEMLDCSRTKLYDLIKNGLLERIYITGAPRITTASIERPTQQQKGEDA